MRNTRDRMRSIEYTAMALVGCAVMLFALAIGAHGQASKPGGAGHALLFSDNIATLAPFHDMPTEELTFEAWVKTSDSCHTGAIVSYAEETDSTDAMRRVRAFNSFVIWDIKDLLACRDFELLDRIPDPEMKSCRSAFKKSKRSRSRIDLSDGEWHHIAVTWTSRKNGLTVVYVDGMKRAEAETGKTDHIKPGGAFVIGAEQDCLGGCFEKDQAFYGYMDEVRIWRKARTQSEILKYMRFSGQKIDETDLVAYFKFDDPALDRGVLSEHRIAKDSSGYGNDLNIVTMPKQGKDSVEFRNRNLGLPSVDFQNSYAMQSHLQGMPDRDITVEFWARTPKVSEDQNDRQMNQEIFSFSTVSPGNGDVSDDDGYADKAYIDDAILIEKYNTEFKNTRYLDHAKDLSTVGSISVHINANREGNGFKYDNWIDYAVHWVDDEWHHIAVSWKYANGETKLYFDGVEQKPFWSSDSKHFSDKSPKDGGVKPYIAARTERSSTGSLVLGQNQECYAGCFSPTMAYHGSIAELRIWDHVVSKYDIIRRMKNRADREHRLAFHYDFQIFDNTIENQVDTDLHGVRIPRQMNKLHLGGSGPLFHYSDAPLQNSDGLPVSLPSPGGAGHALELDDKQVLMLENFQNFPSSEITVEFWMWSVDKCRMGTPFSYATGDYEKEDNSFLIFNYNNWGVAVMEDEGSVRDHHAGLSATDGLWHHIAVTWESNTGKVIFYDNGRPVWTTKRSQGKRIASGGTLVVGREQDCKGGCFDSGRFAKGDTQAPHNLEYGPEDFFGMVEEMRIWRVVRTEKQINEGMRADDGRTQDHGYDNPGVSADHPDLVAYYKFDAGEGYVVEDATGRGNDLKMLYEPKWRVVNWLSICGNGIVEGAEECDDGNEKDGDGCSRLCAIESGWTCTDARPSLCTRKSDIPSYVPPSRPSSPPSDDGHSSGKTDRRDEYDGKSDGKSDVSDDTADTEKSTKQIKHHHGGLIFFFFFIMIVGGLSGFAYVKRYEIYDRFPKVKTAVDTIKDKLKGRRNQEYGMLHLDPVESEVLAPEFVGMQPGPGNYKPPSPRNDTSES